MNTQVICILTLLFPLCLLSQDSETRGWKGIIPLHSSEADVRKKIGMPNGGPLVQYKLEDVNVDFNFSSGPCNEGWNVPAGAVLEIIVNVKKNRPQLSGLNLDMRQYEKSSDPELLDISYYVNKKLGITYVIWRAEVNSIYYSPSEDDNNLKCKTDK